MKNALTAGLFILVLSLPFWLMPNFLRIKKEQVRRSVKKELKSALSDKDYIILRFSKSQTQTLLRWEHAKEFEYNGFMYDIVSQETRNDSVFYKVWKDHEETKVNRQLKNILAALYSQPDFSNQNQLLLFFKTIILHPKPDFELKNASFLKEPIVFYNNHYQSPQLLIFSPPPESITLS